VSVRLSVCLSVCVCVCVCLSYVYLSSCTQNSSGDHGSEGYQLTARLIEINPDYYTLWNYRRRIVQTMLSEADANRDEVLNKELQLTERALRRNPKSYCAWHHRVWVLDQGWDKLLDEVALCTKYLDFDSRNFHCWDYRQNVLRRLGEEWPLENELKFVRDKINQNFSNYSAWHYRTVVISKMFADTEPQALYAFIDKEFELVQQAFYTDPADQSAWLYHRWLVATSAPRSADQLSVDAHNLPALSAMRLSSLAAQTVPGSDTVSESNGQATVTAAASEVEDSAASIAQQRLERHITVLRRELAVCQELLEEEPNCKYVILTTALMMHGLHACGQHVDNFEQEVLSMFQTLTSLDTYRKQYYEDVRNRILDKVSVA
jgi:geranylgeranyl transferase type-2 subunit alpha